ncbi:MAG: pilus assembly protein TadG-related protein [Methylocystis sp.]
MRPSSAYQALRESSAWRRLIAGLGAFRRDEEGAVAVLVAAAIIPLIGALGLATDTARGYMVKARLSQALDAAALAGGKNIFGADRDADIRMFFDANFPPGTLGADVSVLDITVNEDKTVLGISATATINTTFMRVLGQDELTVAASTEVSRQIDQLDVVLSIDTSGSMGSPYSKIEGARDAAEDLVDILFGANEVSPTVEIDGVVYDLLNVGVVNWNAKVNVTLAGEAFDPALTTSETVTPAFVNPVTGASQDRLYFANNSPVPLLSAPDASWKGCVYARYSGDANRYSGDPVTVSDNTNDADLSLGQVTVGSKQWVGWEPIVTLEGEPRDGKWRNSPTDEPWGSDWYNRDRNCYASLWNDSSLNESSGPDDYPEDAPDRPAYWSQARSSIGWNTECTRCPQVGILPLTTVKQTVIDLVQGLEPDGNTNIPQGLAWAWEVLMPGVPFDEAAEAVPFPRQRAIVLLTDGETVGGNGDAYKGRFGSGSTAGTTSHSAHGYLPSPPDAANTRNNLNNRLKRLAANIKAQGITLYVIQFDNDSETLTNLLKAVATQPNEPYYYNAPTEAELKLAFQQIANNLSKLRLSK